MRLVGHVIGGLVTSALHYYQNDPRLRIAFRQFRLFAFQTMMTESERGGRWHGSLTRKDCNVMIRLCFRREIERRYTHEVQKLCKSSRFGQVDKSLPGDLNQEPLESIVNWDKETAPLITSMMLSLRFNSNTRLTSHLASMKLLAVLVIMCRSAHQNNNNYIALLVAMYLYSTRAKVDAITLLNHLGLSVSYNSLLRKLRDIKAHSAAFIKQ